MFRSILLFGVAGLATASANATTPIHAYEFNNSAIAVDGAGAANGTLQGSATISGGQLHLDGSTGFVSFGSHIVPTGASPYSVFIRINGTPAVGQHTEIIAQGFSSGPGFYIGSSPSGNIRLTDNFSAADVGVAYPTGWHDFLFSSDGAGSRFYIDSALVFSSSTQASTTSGGGNTVFGKQFAGNNEYFQGDVDAIRIYGSAITPGDVVAPGVPEPASWALLIAGFGLTGAAVRRRRSVHA